jgi:Domain of unknown function (DUF4345)
MPAPGHTHKSLSRNLERSSLQWTVGLLALVPIGTGLAGAMFGVRAIEPYASVGVDAESLSRYFSGLLLAIGLAFLTTLPRIEAEGERFRLLTMIVFVGGVARCSA